MAKEVSPNTILHRAPTERPPFTLSQLKKSIPPHCFQRSLLRSSSYLFFDLIVVFVLLYLAHYQIPKLPSPYNYIVWVLYCRCQTTFLGALWVIAHECGHHAFSDYQLLDDTVGFILHSMLLVPYFSFKYSHRRHHSNAASLEFDEGIVPRPKSSLRWFSKYLNDPLNRVMFLLVVLTLGLPMYLLFNFYGQQYPHFASHYDPFSPIYSARERAFIFLSDVGILAAFYTYYRLAQEFSWGSIAVIYGVPLLILNSVFVVITYLHHTHPALPHYDSSEWDWLRGALSTVDRDYGFLNKVIHNITDTHVVHHLFPMLPHYHAVEATEAIKPVLGEYYRFDDTNPIIAMWREIRDCIYVDCDDGEKSKGVYWFTNKF